MVFSARTRPSPWHLGHGWRITLPSPAQPGHGDTDTNWPNTDRAARRTSPVPPPARPPPAPACHAVAIVRGALLGITQHLVRLRDLLELLFGRRLLRGSDAVGMVLHGQAAVRLLDLRLARVARHPQQGVVVARLAHSSSSPTSRLVWSTSATILSYAMRVGPSTPITPDSAPRRYEAVTSVKGESRESRCSLPIVMVSPWPSRLASAWRSRSRRSVTSSSPWSRSCVANSGCPASSCALPSTTPAVAAAPAEPPTRVSASSMKHPASSCA